MSPVSSSPSQLSSNWLLHRIARMQDWGESPSGHPSFAARQKEPVPVARRSSPLCPTKLGSDLGLWPAILISPGSAAPALPCAPLAARSSGLHAGSVLRRRDSKLGRRLTCKFRGRQRNGPLQFRSAEPCSGPSARCSHLTISLSRSPVFNGWPDHQRPPAVIDTTPAPGRPGGRG